MPLRPRNRTNKSTPDPCVEHGMTARQTECVDHAIDERSTNDGPAAPVEADPYPEAHGLDRDHRERQILLEHVAAAISQTAHTDPECGLAAIVVDQGAARLLVYWAGPVPASIQHDPAVTELRLPSSSARRNTPRPSYSASPTAIFADLHFWASQGVRLFNGGPDPIAGRIHVTVGGETPTAEAQRLMSERYGPVPPIVVVRGDPGSRTVGGGQPLST